MLELNINMEDLWKEIWSRLVPFGVEVFAWQLLYEWVAVKHELAKRGMITNDLAKYAVCQNELETIKHLFFHCQEI